MTTRHETLETRVGKGQVHDTNGKLIGDADYDLHVFREVHDEPGGQTHGHEDIEGTVSGIDALSRVGEPLVLTLEDGRKLDFYFEDSTGIIIARGDIRKAEG